VVVRLAREHRWFWDVEPGVQLARGDRGESVGALLGRNHRVVHS